MDRVLRKRMLKVFFLSFLGSSFFVQGSEVSEMFSNTHNRNQLVIAFDLHGVLFNFDYPKLLAIIGAGAVVTAVTARLCGWKAAAALASIPLLFWGSFGVWYLGYKKWYGKSPSVESYLQGDLLLQKALMRVWLSFANLFVPNKQLFDLAWKLKNQGHTVLLASNVGQNALAELRTRYGDCFERNGKKLFDNVFNPGCAWQLKAQDAERFDQGWLVKTSNHYFDGLFSFVQQQVLPSVKKILFIDDNRHFVERAHQDERFKEALLFKRYDELCNKLRSLGISV